MKLDNKFKLTINNSVVRIIAEIIDINWQIPYLIDNPGKGSGTGFFIDSVHILTCCHVISGAKNVYVEIPGYSNEKYKCEIVGICPEFDIGLLKILNHKSKFCVKLGNSDLLKPGMDVCVVGYPRSYTGNSNNPINNLKYTMGIISGQQYGLIQTDSAINPGNSGGPLFYNNKVIGINSLKLVGDDVENIGYAIPINYYKIIKNDFDNKIIYRPSLGFEYINTDDKIIEELTNKKIKNGIIITKIYDNSLLKKTKIKEGAILTKINNMDINNYGLVNKTWINTKFDINNILNLFKLNESINIEYYNNKNMNKNMNIKCEKITLKLVPYIPKIRSFYPVFEKVNYFVLSGVIFMNLTYNNITNYNYDLFSKYYSKSERDNSVVIVSFIFPNTQINVLNNIKIDDVITKINNIKISDINNIKKILKTPIIINKKKFLKIENSDKKYVLISYDDVIDQDNIFSKIYKYDKYDLDNKL